MGVFAELDRKMVAKRLRDGCLAKAVAGRKAVGDYPFGYAAIGKGRERDVGPIETEQKAAIRIVELRRAGRSYREIATARGAEGHKPRRAASWSAAAVRNVALWETPGAKLTAEQRSRQARKAARSRWARLRDQESDRA
jgi:DNA invertase Pin-like site-specific DNA recombinase